jgi:TPR repeat protein
MTDKILCIKKFLELANSSPVYYNNDLTESQSIDVVYDLYKNKILIGKDYDTSDKAAVFFYCGVYCSITGKDNIESYQWLKMSADLNNHMALYQLGCRIYHGIDEQADLFKALQLFKQSANGGNKDAMFSVAEYYIDGTVNIVEKDEKLAYDWYFKASELGHIMALNKMGEYCLRNKEEKQAFIWFRKGTLKNDYSSMKNLVKCLNEGLGTDVNKKLASRLENCYLEILNLKNHPPWARRHLEIGAVLQLKDIKTSIEKL